MEESCSVPVSVQRRIHIVPVHKDTTAKDVLSQLAHVSQSAKPQVLLEVWNSCSRVCYDTERLRESITKWGDQARKVSWVTEDKDKFPSRRRTHQRNWRRRAFRGLVRPITLFGVGGIATRKAPHGITVNAKVRRLLKKHTVHQLKRQIEACELEMQKLTDQLDGLESLEESSAGQLSKMELIANLEPILQEEYMSITGAVAKEKRTKLELQKHKRELKQIIESRRTETATLEAKIESLKAKVCKI